MRSISVIGAGTMGNGIAHVMALHGYDVNLIDKNESALKKAMQTIEKNLERQVQKNVINNIQKETTLANIHCSQDISSAVASSDLIIEAVTEVASVKKEIFKLADQSAPPNCILASNTSSISISELANATTRPGKVIGMHFMNPVPVMKLVEIIEGHAGSKETSQTIVELTHSIGKIPCVVKDAPGFISNRVLMPMINEAVLALQEGISDAKTIDEIMKLGMAHPMGPLQLADYIGLDVCHNILSILEDGFDNAKYHPADLLTEKVAAGKLGVKTGEGFYKY
jgi:3-hydroxybutyryl-CoA dehydrogenase